MNFRPAAVALLILIISRIALAQITGDVLGAHDLSPSGKSPITGGLSGSCLYCHAPHSGVGGMTPLWNQTLSTQTYTPYTSSTYVETGSTQPTAGADSSLCLSCHDGTVAPGQTVAYRTVPMTGSMKKQDVLGTDMQSSHPFSLVPPLKDAPDLTASLVAQGKTADPTGAVKLIGGNIECTTCHNPHVQAVDRQTLDFLVRDSSSGQLCLACHDPNRSTTGQPNTLAQWPVSIHATAGNKTANQTSNYVGGYDTVAQNSCNSCHMPHNAPGAARLLRGGSEQDCAACHSGGTNIAPAAPNVFAEFAKSGHPFTTGTNVHDANETAVLNQNRHSTCVDCHNPHASNQVGSFPPAPAIRGSQNLVVGISGSDGVSVLTPAINQFENCLRCHGTSTGKATNPVFGYLPVRILSASDPLNVIPQFGMNSISSHPVIHDRKSPFPQPSLLANMTKLDGSSDPSHPMAAQNRILCTDCHNSDDNREFGGAGPNGPHGSKWTHILERRYEFSQAAAPGQPITNLFPTPDLTINGPFALCAKCHDLNSVVANVSFKEHARHIKDGFSCSVCHAAHGVASGSGTISGERLVNFDLNVVAASNGAPISYDRSKSSCTLMCHNHAH